MSGGKKKPVKVRPSIINSAAFKLYSDTNAEGATKPAEFWFNTTNRDKCKIQVNFKRTPSGDTSELEVEYQDLSNALYLLKEYSYDDRDTIEPVVLVGKGNFVNGQYSEEPVPAGKLILGRTDGVFWLSLIVGSGKPALRWPLKETRFGALQNKDGSPLDPKFVSKIAARSFVDRIGKQLAISLDDRFIPWQHRELIQNGEETPYSDPKHNFAYINTWKPNGGGAGNTGGGGNAPSTNFDNDIPF